MYMYIVLLQAHTCTCGSEGAGERDRERMGAGAGGGGTENTIGSQVDYNGWVLVSQTTLALVSWKTHTWSSITCHLNRYQST